MKKLLIVCLILGVTGALFADGGSFVIDNFNAGLGPELNVYTRDGIAIGGLVSGGLEFNTRFATGLQFGFYHDMDTVGTFDAQAFFRYYLPLPVKIFRLFAQPQAGIMVSFEDNGAYPSFVGGISIGSRIGLTDSLYIETAIRGGYPYMWGIGVTLGYKFGGSR